MESKTRQAASTLCGTPTIVDLLHCKYTSEVSSCLQDSVWTARNGGGRLGCRSHRRGMTENRGPGRERSTFTNKEDAVSGCSNHGLFLGSNHALAQEPTFGIRPKPAPPWQMNSILLAFWEVSMMKSKKTCCLECILAFVCRPVPLDFMSQATVHLKENLHEYWFRGFRSHESACGPSEQGRGGESIRDFGRKWPHSRHFASTHSKNFHPRTCLCRIEMSYLTVISHPIFMAIGAAT